MSNNQSPGKIDSVIPVKSFNSDSNAKWTPVLKTFDPFGPIAEMYAKTLAYKIETKRLDIELVRIQSQANIAHNIIDKTFKLKMEELQHRRIALIGFSGTVNNELKRFPDDTLAAIVILTDKLIMNDYQPEKSIDYLEKSAL